MKLSVLQWNVWYKEDIRNVLEFLQSQNADIICLQELTIGLPEQHSQNTPDFIASGLGYQSFHQEIPIESTDGTGLLLANGIFSRFPINETRSVWINEPKAAGGYDDEYRAYVEAEIDLGDTAIHVSTTHMSYTHAFQGTQNKVSETARLTEALKEHKEKFIFTGDLNATPGSDTINSISALLQNAGPPNGHATWTTKPFSYNGFEAETLDWRLDYIFTSSDIKVLKSEVIHTEFSDHLPIRIEIEV